MLFQGLPSAARSAPAVSRSPAGAAGPPAVSPDYMILGELRGSSVIQSPFPRSFPIDQGIQFAATYYTAGDLARAYGASSMFSSGVDGRGETIAIVDAYGDPTIYQDVAAFDREYGLPAANLTIVPVGPYEPANGITQGWDAETALDVEAAHAMAPYARINLVVAANSSNALFEAVRAVVDQRLGNVASMSWGLAENLFGESGFSAAGFLNYPYVEYYLQKGAQEGITFFASSGDYGAFGGSYAVTASYPASSPFVTAVGGTTLYLATAGNSSSSYQGESAWSVSPQYVGTPGVSSGGGVSDFFAQPYYQAPAYSSSHRAEPDVAADANPYTGLAIVVEGQKLIIGGTSLSSPLWAGMAADLDQYLGKSVGLLNPYLYAIYSDPARYRNDFNQVSSGFNGEYSAGPGYNVVTGIGSPNLPALASDLKSLSGGMSVAAATSRGGGGSSAPAQYAYGDSFTISAEATLSGAPVTSGSFAAKLYGPQGFVAGVPLAFNGTRWTGVYSIPPAAPPGEWAVVVAGGSGAGQGTGMAEVNVGDGLAILGPVPYPYAQPVQPGVPFQVSVLAQDIGGAALPGLTLTAYLYGGGSLVEAVPLGDLGGGSYGATTEVSSGQPQGSYVLKVEGAGVGSVYEYFYVGEGVVGVIVPPNDEAVPSAAPGQNVVLLAKPETASYSGVYTSNVTAKVYSLSGALAASVPLSPAPRTVQFGDLVFFGYQQANFTVPSGFAPGFYKVQFVSSYAPIGSTGPQLGNFTTGFYVSGGLGSYSVTHQSAVYEGQKVDIAAKVVDAGGAPVTSGVFFATVVPSGYAYESYLTDVLGYTGVSMRFNSTLGEWQGSFQVPSPLTSPNAFVGNTLGVGYGPYTVFISGESSSGANVVDAYSYLNVLPYAWIGSVSMDRSNAGAVPLVASSGGTYTLSDVAASRLAVTGVNITLINDYIQNLTVSGSTVVVDSSVVGSASATGSELTLAQGTSVGSLSLSSTLLNVSGGTYASISPALPAITVSGLSATISGTSPFSVVVTGAEVSAGSVVATIDGSPTPVDATPTSTGVNATGTVRAGSLADGVHTLEVTVKQTDGVPSTASFQFATDAQTASRTAQDALAINVSMAAAVIAVVAVVFAALATRKRPKQV